MNDKVFYPDQKKEYPIAVKAKGIYIWDDKGKQYIDASSGPVASIIGHGVTEIQEAMMAQMKEIEFAHRFKFTNEPARQLAEIIAKITPKGIEKTLFLSGGSEAIEAAIKMARAYFLETGKPMKYKVISRRMSYHGNTIGALSLSGHVNRRRKYAPMLIDVTHVAPAYCYHCPFGKKPLECDVDCVKDFEAAIINEGPENVSAIIIEPIGGAGLGSVVPDKRYLPMLRNICDKYEVLMIADEVMTGMGRTGRTWAIDHWDVIPDIICTAKGLSGGYAPLGTVSVKDYIYEVFQNGEGNFAHGHTYGSNPVSMAAGVAVVNYILKNELIENSAKMGDYLMSQLYQIARKHMYIGNVRGLGLMTGVEFVKDFASRTPFDTNINLTNKIIEKAFKEGMILYGAPGCIDGMKGDAVMIAPPITINKDEVDLIIEIFDRVLTNVFNQI